MKTKRINKKLTLNKTTIARLDNRAMVLAKGGVVTALACTLITRFWPECCSEGAASGCTDPDYK